MTAADVRGDGGQPSGPPDVPVSPATAGDQRATDEKPLGETDLGDIEMPEVPDKEPVPGVPVSGDPSAPPSADENTLTAKDNPLEQSEQVAPSKQERPVELPAVDKSDLARRREGQARRAKSAPEGTPRSDPEARATDTEEANSPFVEKPLRERRGAAATEYDGPERRSTVDSTHGLGSGQPAKDVMPGGLTLDLHGRRPIPGDTYTATYVFEDDAEVAPGAGATDLVLELGGPRSRRVLPVVRTGDARAVSCTFPVEDAGAYRLRLLRGGEVIASAEFTA